MTALAADNIGPGRGCNTLHAIAIAMVCLLSWTLVIFEKPAHAAGLSPPSLRAWQRPNEGQLTIEWARAARFQQERIGDRLILRFSKPLGDNAHASLRRLSNFIVLDRTTSSGNELALALRPAVFSKVKVRGERVVTVDFSRNTTSAPRSNITVSAVDNGIRLTLDWIGSTRVKTVKDINELRLVVTPPQDLDPQKLAELRQNLKPWFHDLDLLAHGDRTALSFIFDPGISPAVVNPRSDQTIVDFIRAPARLPEPAAAPARTIFMPAKKPAIGQDAAQTAREAPPIPVMRPVPRAEAQSPADAMTTTAAGLGDDRPSDLVINWHQPVAAAFFLRAGYLWAVFDQSDESLLASAPSPPSAFGPGSIVSAEGGMAIRFPLLKPVNIQVSRTSESQWRIEPVLTPAKPKPLSIEHGEGSATLRIMPLSGEQIVTMTDPIVGDQINVLPLRDPGIGQPARRRFVDLELLPTVQGVAWRQLNDRLMAEVGEETLIFSKPNGLSLSKLMPDLQPPKPAILEASAKKNPAKTEPERAKPSENEGRPADAPKGPGKADPARMPAEPGPASYVSLAKSGVERELVNEYRRIRRQAIAKAAPENRDRARLDLARLLVSERLGTEARIVLDTISDDAGSHIALQKQALSGVSAFLIGDHAKASGLLLDSGLNEDEEIDIWRAALKSSEQKWPDAAKHWQDTSKILDAYPPRLKLDLGLMALETAIETNDDKMIRKGMRRLSSLPLDAYDLARFEAMRALKAERSGDLDRARALLSELADSPNPTVRTSADFELVALDLRMNAGDADALAALDRRTPLWRGHPQEQAMLDKLARHYVDANALRRALTIWRRLISLYPDAASDQEMTKARQDVFVQALANEGEPAIDQVDVYAIYLDFIDLIPSDPEAREVHRHLARHLQALNLLDEAIDVLQSLMTSATDGLERAALSSEIAKLMLKQGRAAPALASLDGTEAESAGGSSSLIEERLLTRAEALHRLDRPDDALRVIRDLQSRPARRLRAMIFWNERRWPRLAAAVEAYFADTDAADPLSHDEQELVLWLALARQKDGDREQLSAIRNRFQASMQGGTFTEAFEVATQKAVRTSDIRSLLAATSKHLAEIKRFREAAPMLR